MSCINVKDCPVSSLSLHIRSIVTSDQTHITGSSVKITSLLKEHCITTKSDITCDPTMRVCSCLQKPVNSQNSLWTRYNYLMTVSAM